MITIRHRAEYALFLLAAGVARLLTDATAAALGAALGRFAYRPIGIRRRVVEEQIARAFPHHDADWIRRTALAAYIHLGREAVALLRLVSLGPEDVVRLTRFEGFERLREVLDTGGGLVLVTGHLGNWEIAGASVAARGVPMDAVAQRQANPLFDRAITRVRQRFGIRMIDRRDAAGPALRALRAGRVVGFLADQDARGSGVFVPFFGRPASTHRGPALLALRARVPLFLGTLERLPTGAYRAVVEEISVQRDGPLEEAVERLTAAFTRRLEATIQRIPEQYFWHHRRWKTEPRAEPPRNRSATAPV